MCGLLGHRLVQDAVNLDAWLTVELQGTEVSLSAQGLVAVEGKASFPS